MMTMLWILFGVFLGLSVYSIVSRNRGEWFLILIAPATLWVRLIAWMLRIDFQMVREEPPNGE